MEIGNMQKVNGYTGPTVDELVQGGLVKYTNDGEAVWFTSGHLDVLEGVVTNTVGVLMSHLGAVRVELDLNEIREFTAKVVTSEVDGKVVFEIHSKVSENQNT